jgi:ribosome biogenesis GTPase / thiamine phosphate phosphatase
MIEFDFERLRTLGLTPALANRAHAVRDTDSPSLQLFRLTEVHRDAVRLHDGIAEFSARALPRLTRRLTDEDTALAVGDWVLALHDEHRQTWVHERIAPLSHINRRDADGRRHPVVSNVDTALLVMGLDDDFNPRRLERYLALVHSSGGAEGGAEGGVAPVVVLTKADVIAHVPGALEERVAALQGRMPAHVDLLAVDGTDPSTAERLSAYLGVGQTLVVLGSSGAGKSTLTNTLLGRVAQDTGAVREHDSRGKHTTTSRSLHRLPGGACVIDTPGLRTLRPDADEATLAASFGDIESLAGACRFRDCTHHDEPGCAVREGVAPDRVRNYHKLLREARRDTMSVLERQQQLSVWKQRGRGTRERMKLKREGVR